MSDITSIISEVKKKFAKSNPDIIYDPQQKIHSIPSGNFTFDLISQVGGFPCRRISEVFGMEQSGKTSLLYATFAKLQRDGGVGVLFDFEGAWDPSYAENVFGLVEDKKTFTIFSPLTIEEGDGIIELLWEFDTKTGKPKIDQLDLVAFDSVDAMKPKSLIECSLDQDRRIGAQAIAVGRWVAKTRYASQRMGFAAVFTNQMRVNINISKFSQSVGTGAGYNVMESYTTPGGYALRFYASLRMKLEYGGQDKNDSGENALTGQVEKQRVGNKIKVINVKNKVGVPFLKGVSNFDFPVPGQKGGWNKAKDIIEILKKRGRITQRATRFVYRGLEIEEWTNVGSRRKSEKMFADDPSLMSDAENLIRSLLSNSSETLLEKAQIEDVPYEELKGQDNPNSIKGIDIKELVSPEVKDEKPLNEETI